MIKETEVYKIGTLTRVHALKGEVSFAFTDDVWDRVDADYLVLQVDGILVPFFLEEYRFRSDSVALLKFVDVDNADDAQALVGCDVFFPKALTPEEAPTELQWSHFTGFDIYLQQADEASQTDDADARYLGSVTRVDDTTPNVLFYVTTSQGEQLIPAVDDFIVDVDHAARRLTMHLPEGLLELN